MKKGSFFLCCSVHMYRIQLLRGLIVVYLNSLQRVEVYSPRTQWCRSKSIASGLN